MAGYEATDVESQCPTDSDEDQMLLQPITSIVAEDVKEAIRAYDEEICRLVGELGDTKRQNARMLENERAPSRLWSPKSIARPESLTVPNCCQATE